MDDQPLGSEQKAWLADFLYILLRDELPAGNIERVIRQTLETKGKKLSYTLKPAYKLAEEWADRLLAPTQPPAPEPLPTTTAYPEHRSTGSGL